MINLEHLWASAENIARKPLPHQAKQPQTLKESGTWRKMFFSEPEKITAKKGSTLSSDYSGLREKMLDTRF